ncbi:MAG: 4-hydroxy-3-methylbut-2-enyl diphosphate reductase [Fusobacteriota bacterium]
MKNRVSIKRAKKMGFCFGVKEALTDTEKIISENPDKNIYMFGMLVHNKDVIKRLTEKGLKIISQKDISHLTPEDIVIIRAHGIKKEIQNKLKKTGVKVYDLACIFVKKSRDILEQKQKQGFKIIFIGDENHPEVKGIISYGDNTEIISGYKEIKNYKFENDKKYYILEQTTLNNIEFKKIKKYLKENKLSSNTEIGNTICGATYERQKATEELAKTVDMIFIIGGYNSSNTKKLYKIARKINNKSYHIENHEDIKKTWFENKRNLRIGITAGASTPAESIKNVEKIIEEEIMSEGTNFEEMLENYLPDTVEEGEITKGIILRKDREHGYLDIGTKGEGVVNAREIEDNEIGDEIEVMVLNVGEGIEENLRVSRRAVELKRNWSTIVEKAEAKEKVTGEITRKVKGGYIVRLFKYNCFMPGSLSQYNRDDNPVGEKVEVIIKDYEDGKRKKVILSQKEVKQKEQEEQLEKLNEGDIIEGEILHIKPYGLIVKVGALSGLIHISEIAWKRIENLEELFEVGEKVKAKILSINENKKSLKLSKKQLSENPWDTIEEKYEIGSVQKGKVVRIKKYGAFVELEEGVEGLLHISELSWSKSVSNPKKYMELGDEIEVKILDIDKEKQRIKLSLKQLKENPWDNIEEKYPIGSEQKGKIAGIKNFGLFVELEEGVDVFVHVSDLGWVDPSVKEFKKGDEVEFEITEIDKEENKIKGSVKRLIPNPLDKIFDKYSEGDVIKREIISIAPFGIFIELEDGIDGMIHISEASKDYIKDLKEKFEIGQEVEAEIIKMDKENKKIKLSIKKLEEQNETEKEKDLIEEYGTVGDEEE